MAFRFFRPDMAFCDVYTITPEALNELGVKGVVFDIDNTIAPYEVERPTEKMKEYFASLREAGIKMAFVSNNQGTRVTTFNEGLGLFYVCKAGKPSPKGVRKCIAHFGLDKSEVMAVGDQIFTDCIAAHRAGASPESVHVEAMLEMAIRGSGSVSLPGALRAECRSGRIVFSSDTREKDRQIYPGYEPITLREGENPLPSGKLMLVCGKLTNDFSQIYNLSTSAHINPDRIKGRIYARPRREGDRILCDGMHRSVKKLISERLSSLPLEERRSLPVICDGEEIIWIPYLEVADPFRGDGMTLFYQP